MLIGAGAHVNIKDKYGNTTLIKAVTKRNENYVSMLIEAGADVNVTNGQALAEAAYHGYVVCMALLILKGSADVNVNRALNYAASCGQIV